MQSLIFGSPYLSGNNTIPGVKIPDDLMERIPGTIQSCKDFGLKFDTPVVVMLTWDEISEIAAYGGFPNRYPHWSFGMEYEELSRGYEFGKHRIFEMVINTSPLYIYCLDSNSLIDNVTVVAHAIGHGDYFKNNLFFKPTNKNAMNMMADHGTRIERYMERWGRQVVSDFMNKCLSVDDLIDPALAWKPRKHKDVAIFDQRKVKHPSRLIVDPEHDYMQDWINDPNWINEQKKELSEQELRAIAGVFEGKDKDIFKYIIENAPMTLWQRDVAHMLYEESQYFFPQRMTKTCNEGHACVTKDMLINTDNGMLRAKDLVENKLNVKVSDGEQAQNVTNYFIFENRKVVKITTNRGYVIEGSINHRVVDSKGEWVELGNLKEGDSLKLVIGTGLWNEKLVETPIIFKEKTWSGLCEEENLCYSAFVDYKENRRKSRKATEEKCVAILEKGGRETSEHPCIGSRKEILIPEFVTEKFAEFLGDLIGDGHISDVVRDIGLTTGQEEHACRFASNAKDLFGLDSKIKKDANRWRVSIRSKNLRNLLVDGFGFFTGVCARKKRIPDLILRSPKKVQASFIRALFDCDGYAGNRGIILATSSTDMKDDLLPILLNFGIVCNAVLGGHDIWYIQITGLSAKKYEEEIGFTLTSKKEKLRKYIDNHQHWFRMPQHDTVLEIEHNIQTVYDMTVEETHKYVCQGFINHNSWVDFKLMACEGLAGDEGIVDYALHKASVLGGQYSMNPYALGFKLLLDIEERWDKGRHGREYEECKLLKDREHWDKQHMKGKDKVFEVREMYNDYMLINEFLDQDFCDKWKFYIYQRYPNGEYKIVTRDYKEVRRVLLSQYANGHLPDIRLVEPNFRGKRIMLLEHQFSGLTLHPKETVDTLRALFSLWKAPTAVSTFNDDEEEIVYVATGPNREHTSVMTRDDFEAKKNW